MVCVGELAQGVNGEGVAEKMLGSRASQQASQSLAGCGFPSLHGNVRGRQGNRGLGGERPLCIDLTPVRFNPE